MGQPLHTFRVAKIEQISSGDLLKAWVFDPPKTREALALVSNVDPQFFSKIIPRQMATPEVVHLRNKHIIKAFASVEILIQVGV